MLLLSGCSLQWSRVAHCGPMSPSTLLTIIVDELVDPCTVIITLFKMKKWTSKESHIETWITHPVFFLCHTAFQFQDSVLNRFIGMTCITLKSALISGKLCAKKGNQRSWMTFNRPQSLWKFQRRCSVEWGATHRNQLLASGLSRPRKQKVTAQMRKGLGVAFLDENLSVRVLARTSLFHWVFDGNF